MIAILNTSILTTFGEYTYSELSMPDAKVLLKDGYISYVGHSATNEIISKLFGIDLPFQREMYYQKSGDCAIVFKLNKRLSEGEVIKTKDEIETIGYSIGLLIKK